MFAKSPAPGRSKTRLARGGIGELAAAELSAAFIGDLAARLGADPRWRLVVHHPVDDDATRLRELVPPGVAVAPEPVLTPPPRDLGVAMTDAMVYHLERGAERVALLGSDVPHLPVGALAAAFEALADADLVVGPDDGGGFCLVAMKQPLEVLRPTVEDGPIVWSAGTDCAEIGRRATRAGLRWVEVEGMYDLDTPAELQRLCDDLTAGRVPASDLPRTVQWLTAQGLL